MHFLISQIYLSILKLFIGISFSIFRGTYCIYFTLLFTRKLEFKIQNLERCSIIKGVLRNFAKFTGKHLRQSLFLKKVGGLRPGTLLKRRLLHRCFPVNFAKILRTPFIQNTSGRLLSNLSLSNKMRVLFESHILSHDFQNQKIIQRKSRTKLSLP